MRQAAHNWRWLFRHWKASEVGLDLDKTGSSVDVRRHSTTITTANSIRVKPLLPIDLDDGSIRAFILKGNYAIKAFAVARSRIGQLRLIPRDSHRAAHILPNGVAQCVLELHLIGFAGSGWPGEGWSMARSGRGDSGIQKSQREYITAMIEVLSDQI